jgi:hypothetical protein
VTALDHVLLTRFNLPSAGHESLVRAKENWLRDRVALFERYCLPSVLAQSRQLSWLVYFDPMSPPWLLDWVAAHAHQGHFRPVLREAVSPRELVGDISDVLGGGAGRAGGELLTTNLDNDDSLAVDFAARVQDAHVPALPAAVYVGDGLITSGETLYRRRDPHNAFCSVRSGWDDPVTCWVDWHNLLPERMPAVVLRGRPGWLQVIHGANVSNRVRGRRTRPAIHRKDFPGLVDDLPEPGPGALVRDALVAVPARAVREGGRAAAKWTVRRVLGREGLDRAKVWWAATRRVLG